MSQDLQHLRRLAYELPRSSSKDEAFQTAVKAADTALRALSLTTDANEKAHYTARAQEFLTQADRIKTSTNWQAAIRSVDARHRDGRPPKQTGSSLLNEPLNSRKLPTREEIVLERAGFLNGVKFPRWQGPPAVHEFHLRDGESMFFDETSELELSEFQLAALDDWKRPAEALPPPSWFPGGREGLGPVMSATQEVDLVQDAATDCSVVASLCASEARTKRGHATLSRLFFHPYDDKINQPNVSENGKYIMRLNFNGCYRKVVIDDRIPTSATDRVIHVMDRNNPGLLWPALVEKAYLKVRGGYDFPGSNSGTDLWILTGWIPEQVFVQSDDMEPDRFWRRISNAFSYGDVLITMGTGKMSSKMEQEICLAGEHDYAVLDLKEVDGQRLMLVKNPWVSGTSWRGRFRAVSITDSQQQAQSVFVQLESDTKPVKSPRDLLNADEQLKPGTFWMDLDNVLQYFESIYLNWNTDLFKHRQDIHFTWDLSKSTNPAVASKQRGPYASLQHNPQFVVSSETKGNLWVLLWRHFQNSIPEDATAEQIESGRHEIDLNGHITLITFASGGRKVMLPENHLTKGWFVDSPQTLLKLEDCEAGRPYTIIPLEQQLAATKQTFTISVFGQSGFNLAEAAPRFPFVHRLSASWSKDTAGGNAQYATYGINPQFAVMVSRQTNLSLLVESCNAALSVHVKLVHGNGKRVYRVRNKDIVVDSKDYRQGCCLAELEGLEAGQYTIICSTFEPDQLGHFGLVVESSQPLEASLLPREGAGRIRSEWPAVTFTVGDTRITAPIIPRRLIKLYAVAKPADQQSTGGRRTNQSHIRLSIEIGTGPHRRVVACSSDGEYVDSAGPVRTDDIDLGPDFRKYGFAECWLVLERMYVSEEAQIEKFSVELFVDQPNAIDSGDWRVMEDQSG